MYHPQKTTIPSQPSNLILSPSQLEFIYEGFTESINHEVARLTVDSDKEIVREFILTTHLTKDLHTMLLPGSVELFATSINSDAVVRDFVINLYMRLRSILALIEEGEGLLDKYLLAVFRDILPEDPRSLLNENLQSVLNINDTYIREVFRYNPWIKVHCLIRMMNTLEI